jgi:isopentenyl-diphosphate delta-isomerase
MTENSELRSRRKKEHIAAFKKNKDDANNFFEHIYLEHNALPEVNFHEIDTSVEFLNKRIAFPMMINAITGGFDEAVEINGNLATVAKRLNIPMAVGSQSIAVSDKTYEKSFAIVRERIGDGIVLGNLNGFASVEQAIRAIDMLGADGLQIHLNPAQEMCMSDGDRDFRGVLSNIEKIVESVKVPIIVKEVGFGISRNVARRLYDVGVSYVDVAGSGGTNFINIENDRNQNNDFSELSHWGIPTALSLIECANIENRKGLICSGGISRAEEVIKALVIGADMVGMSGQVLRYYLKGGEEATYSFLSDMIYKSKIMMLLLGASNISELRKVSYRTQGALNEFIGSEEFSP